MVYSYVPVSQGLIGHCTICHEEFNGREALYAHNSATEFSRDAVHESCLSVSSDRPFSSLTNRVIRLIDRNQDRTAAIAGTVSGFAVYIPSLIYCAIKQSENCILLRAIPLAMGAFVAGGLAGCAVVRCVRNRFEIVAE